MSTIVVGIDLGTTNSTMAMAVVDDDAAPLSIDVPQIDAPGSVVNSVRFPSALYVPLDAEIAAGHFQLPWPSESSTVAGVFAERRAAEVPGRVVMSSKSWLSHAGVDRRGPILPTGATDDVARLSPVDAAARLLTHLASAFAHTSSNGSLADVDVVITVPASFDAAARALTEEAAARAGLSARLTLLEEPQAAFYAWLASMGADWRKHLAPGETVLVVDVGGGTTDFSLIAVTDVDGNVALERLAVGEHILLGGDNMDLALAYTVRQRLEDQGRVIDDWQLSGLTASCRVAKEALFDDDDMASHPVVIPGRGSKLIGGTIRSELTRDDVQTMLVDGFFPVVTVDVHPEKRARSALTTLGLPYATDAAITKHLAAFLSRTVDDAGNFRAPSAVLFNGGVTRAAAVSKRIIDVLSSWATSSGQPAPRVLSGADVDFAVARGAAHFARVRLGKGIRIKSGLARAYYVGLERAELAVPGMAPRVDAVCIAPRGLEEGDAKTLPMELGLVTGEPVRFRLFSCGDRADDVAARVSLTVVEEMSPVETTLEDSAHPPGTVVPVRLMATVTTTGTLEVAAVSTTGDNRWALEFNVRGQ